MKVWKHALAATMLAVGAVSSTYGQGSAPEQTLGPVAYRVGKSVLFTLHQRMGPDGRSIIISSYLAGCDGSWLSEAMRFEGIYNRDLTPRQQQEHLLAEMQKPSKLPVIMWDWSSEIGVRFSGYRSRILSLCKSAPAIPRNTLVPLTYTADSVQSVVLGTVARQGNTVEMWLNDAKYREEPIMLEGKPLMSNGVEAKSVTFTGSKRMVRKIQDCASRSSATTSVTEYDDSGKVINTASTTRNEATYFEIVPGSIGEGMLEFVCKVF